MNETPWMLWLLRYEGQHELAGDQDNPFIMSLYKYGHYQATHDEVPWCACCANAALEINGFIGTGRADALSFATCGDASELKYGAIIVIQHPKGGHHVTFFSKWVDQSKGLIELLGGNQSDALKKSVFNVSGNKLGHDEIIATRWPRPKVNLTPA